MQITAPLWQKARGIEEPLDESERGKRKSWHKTQHSKNWNHGILSHHFMAHRWGSNGNSDRLFSWAPKSLQTVTVTMELKDPAPWKKSYDQLRQRIKKQRHYFSNKGPSSQSYGFSSSHAWMWDLDYKESWVPKNCGVGKDSWESLGLQGDPTSQS